MRSGCLVELYWLAWCGGLAVWSTNTAVMSDVESMSVVGDARRTWKRPYSRRMGSWAAGAFFSKSIPGRRMISGGRTGSRVA
jgi:hypothetical protein